MAKLQYSQAIICTEKTAKFLGYFCCATSELQFFNSLSQSYTYVKVIKNNNFKDTLPTPLATSNFNYSKLSAVYS